MQVSSSSRRSGGGRRVLIRPSPTSTRRHARFAAPTARICACRGQEKARRRRAPRRSRGEATRSPSGTRSTTRRRRPAASSPRRPRARSTLDATSRVLRSRASSPARSRPSTATTLRGHRRHRRPPADARRGQGDDQADARHREPAEGADRVHHGVPERWREKTECAEDQDVGLLERPTLGTAPRMR